MIRRHGELVPLEGADTLTPEVMEGLVVQMLDGDEGKLAEFRADNEVDFAYSIRGLARFRVNAFRQRGSVSIVCRAIPIQIKTVDELLLPPVINELAEEERGIILLTGTTGSGKSSTLAAMIDQINSAHAKHIVTIEDPIEFLHQDKRSVINQREVDQDHVRVLAQHAAQRQDCQFRFHPSLLFRNTSSAASVRARTSLRYARPSRPR